MEGDPEDSNIEIRGIPQELDENLFLMLLENSLNGYEQIAIREFNSSSRTATISIKSPHIVEKVLNDGCLKWENKTMGAKRVSVDKHEQTYEAFHPTMKTVLLTSDYESINKENILFYLESERCGGGKVKEFQVHSSGLLVTFEDANVARAFSSRRHEFCETKLKAALLESWPMTNSSCAIEIYVHDEGSKWDASMTSMLLESPRYGGSPEIIEEVFEEEDGSHRIVATLKRHDNVESIINKTNSEIRIGQSTLTLKILSPAKPPTFVENPDKKKLLFLELNPQSLVDKEALKTFIEKCSKALVQQLLFCCENDRVLVQFKDEPDYRNILSVLCCKPFKGTMISVQRISKTKQIQVTGWKHHDDMIKIYFEKYGEGQVEHYYKIGNGVLIVTFTDFDSVDKVLSSADKISKTEISVVPYIEAFEGKSFDFLSPPPLVPDDIKIPIKKEIYGFLFENRQYKDDIENELTKLNCSICWPCSHLIVEATLRWNDKNTQCRNVKSWSSEVVKCFKAKIEEYDSCEIPVSDNVFDFVTAEARRFKPGKAKMLKKIYENNKQISAVGLKDVIQEFKSLLEKQSEIARNVDDKVVKFNQPQFLLINKSDLIENFKKTYKITVSQNTSDYTMMLKGPAENVKTCLLKLVESRNKIKEEELALLGKYPEFFKQEDVMNKIEKEFHLKKIIAVLRVYSGTLLLYSFEHLGKAQDCLTSMFTEEEFEIDKSEKEAMKYKEWSTFEKDLKSKFKESFTWSAVDDKMHILASSNELNKIVKEFHKYFKEHARVTETFVKPQPMVDFLTQTAEFIEIRSRAGVHDVQIKVEPGSALQLSGKRAKVVAIMDDLEQFCSKIVSKTYQLEYKANNLFEPQASNTLMGICGKCKVHINLKYSMINHGIGVDTSTKSENCKMSIICGSIADQRTDVIFNCCPSNLELSHSAISKALLDVAGSQLQDELKTKYETKRLSPGEVVETRGYKLHCDSVYHGYITPWSKSSCESEKAIKLLIKNSLEKASQDKKTSISFPAFGTGKLGVPHNDAAKIMIGEAKSFISRPSSLKEIRFVIYEGDKQSIQAFHSECGQASNGSKASSGGANDNTLHNINGVYLKVVNQDLLEEKCDAIVSSTNHNLAVEGAVGALRKAIMDKAGDKVKKECADIRSLKNGLAMTSSGKLSNCKHIFHVAGKDVSDWERVISEMLEEANKREIKSIAMPLLGTGHQRISVEDIARVILQCFKNYAKNKNSSLKELKVMIPNTSIHSKFKEAFQSINSTSVMHFKEKRGGQCSFGNKVEIEIYGLNNESLKKAIDEIQKELNKVVTEKKIMHQLTNIPPNLFAKIESKHDVKIASSKDTIKIVGKKDISAAIEEMNELIKEQMQKEFKSIELETFTKYVTWSFCRKDGKATTYGNHSTYLLESALQRQDPSVQFTDRNGDKHDVVFQVMKDTINGKCSAEVCRTLKGEITLPSSWADMSKESIVELVLLKSQSKEYASVQNLFHAGMLKPAIIKIERIQNPSLYRQYECKKEDMEKKNKGFEKKVWHGTNTANVLNINANNFNRVFGNQGSYGVGVYFAVNPDYSIRSYCPPDQNGFKCIYLAKVLVGNVGKGVAGLREPPELNTATKERFDSVADNPTSPSMYVIFYDCQMYPEYLITFQ